MMRIDWATPKITLEQFEQFLQPYLGSIYDGIRYENNYVYIVTTEQLTGPQEEYITNWIYSLNEKPTNVVTLYEKNDKDLKLCSVSVPVDTTTGIAELVIPAMSERYMTGGYGFFTTSEPMWAKQIEAVSMVIVPADTLFPGQPELPAGTTLKTYHDDEVDSSMQGWRVAAQADGSPVGVMKVETLAGYGKVPAGMGMKIVVQMAGSAPFSGWFTVNMEWGKLG
jgi:hypothetical protein